MKKLTLVSLMCRGKIVRGFVMLPIIEGKAILSVSTMNEMFMQAHGFVPERGQTISIGL